MIKHHYNLLAIDVDADDVTLTTYSKVNESSKVRIITKCQWV